MDADRENEVRTRETRFHDRWAEESARLDAAQVSKAFEAITAPENRFIMKLLGDVRGRKILDIGPGLGESSIYFAMKGADVTAADISPGMIEACLRNARALGFEITGVVSSAEDLNLEKDSFDFVYASNILHHVVDRERFLSSIRDVLKPGSEKTPATLTHQNAPVAVNAPKCAPSIFPMNIRKISTPKKRPISNMPRRFPGHLPSKRQTRRPAVWPVRAV